MDRTTSRIASTSGRAAAHVLIVSDDAQLRLLLGEVLDAHGYHVVSIGRPAACVRMSAADWDAAIVDVAAWRDAARWLNPLDATARVPTIAIAGANDAAAKPLWDRVDAVLHGPLDAQKLPPIVRGLLAGRRKYPTRVDRALTKGPLTLHPLLNAAVVAARETSLTDVETRVLRELMLAGNTPVSRDRLTQWCLGRSWSPHDRSLDTHIKRLRRKLGRDRQGQTPIRTVRGIGYLLLEQWQPAT